MPRENTATVSEVNESMGRLPVAEVTDLARLKDVLAEDAGTALGLALREVCGGIEVRVSAATAVLRLFVDGADLLHPPYIRHVVRTEIARFRSALGRSSSSLRKE